MYMFLLAIIDTLIAAVLTMALQIEKSAYVSLLTMMCVVWASVYDFGVKGEKIH